MRRRPTPGLDRDADGVLVIAARQGSSQAFDELYRTHAGWVAQMARARASREEHIVADVVQEVFTRALENLDRLRDPARFGAWVRTIADHVIVDHHRAAGRSRALDAETAEEIESRGAPPDAIAEASELAGLLRRSVAGLSARDATAITLVSSLGLSPMELGAVLGVSRGAAKVVLHRARNRLKAALRMQVLLERRLSDCEVLWQLVDDGETIAAARHVPSCEQCGAADVQAFAMRSGRSAYAPGEIQPDGSGTISSQPEETCG
jgi:RNA polymerase sigma-70 factor (ECF subfamily)